MHVQHFTTTDVIDTGKDVHIRVHLMCTFEFEGNTHKTTVLEDVELFLKVQSAAAVGGPYMITPRGTHAHYSKELTSEVLQSKCGIAKVVYRVSI